jgi:hypothetical protein
LFLYEIDLWDAFDFVGTLCRRFQISEGDGLFTVQSTGVAIYTSPLDPNLPISNPVRGEMGKPRLASYEESAEASSDGGPGKVGLVGGSTEGGKLGAIGSIREDANQGGI